MKLTFSAKCSDKFYGTLYDNDEKYLGEYSGYSPHFLGGSDYVRMTVDLQTGQIEDWTPLSDENLEEFMNHPDFEKPGVDDEE